MKIAFDVQGTLIGFDSKKVVALFKWFQQQGHEMYVWSYGGRSMARDAIAQLGLGSDVKPMAKYGQCDVSFDEDLMDIAIDDNYDDFLATKNLLLVSDIPDDLNFETLNHLIESCNNPTQEKV